MNESFEFETIDILILNNRIYNVKIKYVLISHVNMAPEICKLTSLYINNQ